MTASRTRDHHLADGTLECVLYIHGGGLHIGEAGSEELSCRRILKDSRPPGANPTRVVYPVGYRLMPQNPASKRSENERAVDITEAVSQQ